MTKEMTIEDLAQIIQKTMASKEDLKDLATKEDIRSIHKEMKDGFDVVFQEIDELRDDMKQDRTARRIINGDLQERIIKVEQGVAALTLQSA